MRDVSMKLEIERVRDRTNARFCRFVVFALCLGFWIVPATQSREVGLAIGHGWAVVREERTVRVAPDTAELLLDRIPAQADLSSLIIRLRQSALPVIECSRIPSSETALPNQDASLITGKDGTVRWQKDVKEARSHPSNISAVRCRFAEPLPSGEQAIELIYRVEGFDWSCSYQIRIRGEQADEKEPISVDVLGLAKIVNPCPRSFDHATVWLIGSDGKEEGDDLRKQPGFLSLDEFSPLSDLWRARLPEAPAEHEYAIQEKVDVPEAGVVHVVVVNAKRKPAEQVYFMDSEEFSLSRMGKDAPLKKIIVFKNSARQGLGIPLPAGAGEIFVGGGRTYWQQDAWIPNTPAEGEIRIDLGVAQNVRGLRQSVDRTPVVSGFYEETFRLITRNESDRSIRLEINEKPPVNLEWSVVRASRPYKLQSNRLVFRPEVDVDEALELDYRLRIRRPGL